MDRTGFHGDFSDVLDVVILYGDLKFRKNDLRLWPPPGGALFGNGGIVSTTEDLAKFVDGLKKAQLFGIQVWNQMIQPHVINSGYSGLLQNEVYQTYGWSCSGGANEDMLFMGGTNNYGGSVRIKYYPNREILLIIVTNNLSKKTKGSVVGLKAGGELESILFER
jgi:hypothetical protein